MVKRYLVSKKQLEYVFQDVLRKVVLPAFTSGTEGKGTVSEARAYVDYVLRSLDAPPTCTNISKDRDINKSL